MIAIVLPGLSGEIPQDNATSLIYAALHFCAQPETIGVFHQFLTGHMHARVDDLPPAEAIEHVAREVTRGARMSIQVEVLEDGDPCR